MSNIEPQIFEEYFELGRQETLSPFITKETRSWSKQIDLKASILAALALFTAFSLSFTHKFVPLSNVFLMLVYFLAGVPALIEAVEDLINFEVNIDVLMVLAAFSSFIIGSGMEGGLLLVLFAISGSMEEAVRTKAKSAISSLHKLTPSTAYVLKDDGTLIERSVKEVLLNTMILVKSGQVIPLDGIVCEGTSSVNLVHLTGENFPQRTTIGDEVPSGGLNLEGALQIRVIRTSRDSTLARIITLVTQAAEARPRLQRWFDRLSRKYAVSIILLSFSFALSFPFLLKIPFFGVEGSLYRALAFLIAASPCALIIALPIAYLSAISVCAKNGILLKGGIALDALASCQAIAFDKTGTLTTGDLTCYQIESLTEKINDQEFNFALSIALGLEKNAIHPIAKSIVDLGKKRECPPAKLQDFQAIPGFGLQGTFESNTVYIGHPEYILDKLSKDKKNSLETRVNQLKKQGELLAVLLVGQKIYIFKFKDTLRENIKSTLSALKKHWNLALVMLTGDHEESANA